MSLLYQAREQVLTKNGLEDAPVTLPHHPLKKFAEAQHCQHRLLQILTDEKEDSPSIS